MQMPIANYNVGATVPLFNGTHGEIIAKYTHDDLFERRESYVVKKNELAIVVVWVTPTDDGIARLAREKGWND